MWEARGKDGVGMLVCFCDYGARPLAKLHVGST
jgi:hypothetical protein